jgi:hypothetical protein
MKHALENCVNKLSKSKPNGMEAIIRDSVKDALPGAITEVPLRQIGAERLEQERRGRVDILSADHAIELKVIRMPRLKATPGNALYDVGQLSWDYWTLREAKKISSAELIILLYGELISALSRPSPRPKAVYREFHNRMFVDFTSSLLDGELKKEQGMSNRRKQIDAIKAMGFDKPCDKVSRPVVVHGAFALVSIEVDRTGRTRSAG